MCVVTEAGRSETRVPNGYLLRRTDGVGKREGGQTSAKSNLQIN
jgi:hypothetical protein